MLTTIRLNQSTNTGLQGKRLSAELPRMYFANHY